MKRTVDVNPMLIAKVKLVAKKRNRRKVRLVNKPWQSS